MCRESVAVSGVEGLRKRLWPRVLVAVLAAAALASCGSMGDDSTLADRVMGLDLAAKPQQPVRGIARSARDGGAPEAQIFMGTGSSTASAPGGTGAAGGTGTVMGVPGAAARQSAGDSYDLNFEAAEVKTVAKVLLGDVLGVTYLVDPRVEGTVSLVSARPMPRRDILPMLEEALKLNGAAIVRNGDTYQIVLASEAGQSGGAVDYGTRRVSPGYGISVLPLQNVSADTVVRLVEGFGAPSGSAKVDASRNLLIVQGTAPERATVMETALAFDGDWMRGQSVGIFPLNNARPEAIITELNRILDSGEGGAGAGLVRFQPIARLNAVLAMSPQPKKIQQVATWVRRLDMADQENARLRVYRVQHGDARRIAAILNNVFAGGSGGSGVPGSDDGSQLSPGGSATTGGGAGLASMAQPTTGGSTSNGGNTTGVAGQAGGDDPTGSEGGFGSTSDSTSTTDDGLGGAGGASGQALLANVRITPDVVNNSILIYADREAYRVIERALVDIDRPAIQVAIEAMIAEVTLNGKLNYGVQYFLKASDLGLPSDAGSISFFDSTDTGRLKKTGPGLNIVLGPEKNPRFILDALRGVTNVKVLSSPSLVVVDNQTATLQVGNEVPVTVQSAANVQTADSTIVNSVEYKNTGVILRVTPRVSANGVVNLQIEQEISGVVRNSSEDSLTPTISQRRVKSQVAINNGQTVVLAGLIQEQIEKNKQGIPIISDVPYIGDLLSSTSTSSERTELVIFIKPQIIRDGVDAQVIAEEMRLKLIGGVVP